MRFILLIAFLIHFSYSFSQINKSTSDTTKKNSLKKPSVHSPRLAMLFSACVPGLGQAYNKKYWKIPIVYATMGTTIYFFQQNNKLYKEYKESYIEKTKHTSGIDYYPQYDSTQVRELQMYYQKNRDLNFILTALFYTLNIADAYVDAHLMTFDVSDNLSLNILPSLNFYSRKQKLSAGITLCLKF